MRNQRMRRIWILPMIVIFIGIWAPVANAQQKQDRRASIPTSLIPLAEGWANNSINAVIFRQSSITTYRDTQFTGFYDSGGHIVLAKRKLGSKKWKIHKTRYRANIKDAHNAISLAVDGRGFLHVSWGMHGEKLRYVRGKKPGSLHLTEKLKMTGKDETGVTYPAFYRLSDGDLLFMYRRGSSGNGDVMLNRYDTTTRQWTAVAHPLIDGQGERNAYMNSLAIDEEGKWHLSWTWRESWDVATNHDIMYAYSPDEGKTWQRSDGTTYSLPITQKNAEVVYPVSKGSELINQTSMTINGKGQPVIATYWKSEGLESPQYHIIWQDEQRWRARQVGNRSAPFSLSGGGTKRIPISRPQLVASDHKLFLIFRDLQRKGGISMATIWGDSYQQQRIKTLYKPAVEMWEPTLDRQAWKERGILYLFVQKVGQGDAEGLQRIGPQPIYILKWNPQEKKN